MKQFQYEYSHKYGSGSGVVEAQNAESAEKKVTESIVVPKEVGGEINEKGKVVGSVKTDGKPVNLKVTVQEIEQPAEA